MTRYAIYWSPPPGDPLAAFGASWLGYDAEDGSDVAQSVVPGVSAAELADATAAPRHYGFHATLKSPFALAEGFDEKALLDAARRLARELDGFALPPLKLAAVSGFLALVPSARCPPLYLLAERCVRELDAFRRPPGAAEVARRREAGLSSLQEAYLAAWGYPYVLDEFRFHLTLTGRLPPSLRARLEPALAPLVAPLCAAPLPIAHLVVFREAAPDRNMRLTARFPLGRVSCPLSPAKR